MDSRYAARLIQNRKTVQRFHSDDINQMTARIITYIEKRHPNAIGLVRDNVRHCIISRISRTAVVD